jgi:hypothetical protein
MTYSKVSCIEVAIDVLIQEQEQAYTKVILALFRQMFRRSATKFRPQILGRNNN